MRVANEERPHNSHNLPMAMAYGYGSMMTMMPMMAYGCHDYDDYGE
jgi:hypothetical protein